MITTTMFPGRYVQGRGVLKRLGRDVALLGDKMFLISDPFVFDNILPRFRKEITASVSLTSERFAGECCDDEINRLASVARSAGCNVVTGIGGGKSLDTAKAVAHKLHLPVAVAPTIASTDAPCSALSVIYTPDGEFSRYLLLPRNPDLVLVDTEIIVQAPVRFLVSGMGDALATWFEAESCQRKYAANMSGDHGSMTAFALAGLCYDTLLEYGVMAKLACEAGAVTPALEYVVEANTLLSGLGFESGGLGASHAIHNGFTVLEPTHKYFHGEKVALGTLAALVLTDRPPEVITQVFAFCESVGLPTTLGEIGLEKVSAKDLMQVARRACAEGETIFNEPVPVSPEKVFCAIRAASRIGEERRGQMAGSR